MAERVGFEPTVRFRITGFQDQLLKPLGHLSVTNIILLNLLNFVNSFFEKITNYKFKDILVNVATKKICITNKYY